MEHYIWLLLVLIIIRRTHEDIVLASSILTIILMFNNHVYCWFDFRIQFDFSFDDAIVKKYNCEVHSFDPR